MECSLAHYKHFLIIFLEKVLLYVFFLNLPPNSQDRSPLKIIPYTLRATGVVIRDAGRKELGVWSVLWASSKGELGAVEMMLAKHHKRERRTCNDWWGWERVAKDMLMGDMWWEDANSILKSWGALKLRGNKLEMWLWWTRKQQRFNKGGHWRRSGCEGSWL